MGPGYQVRSTTSSTFPIWRPTFKVAPSRRFVWATRCTSPRARVPSSVFIGGAEGGAEGAVAAVLSAAAVFMVVVVVVADLEEEVVVVLLDLD